MTENRYIAELERLLGRLPLTEREDIVQDIREYFAGGREDGKTDEEIAKELGSPSVIADELLESYPEPGRTVEARPDSEIIRFEDDRYEEIAIDVQHGTLLLSPSDNHVTTVELTGAGDKMLLTADIVGSSLVIKLKNRRPLLMLFSLTMKRAVLNVTVPKKLYEQLILKTDNGRICAEKLLGRTLRVSSDNGRIQLREAAVRQLEVKTDNGSIELMNAQADRILAKTDNGRIEMAYVEADGIAVETDNGRIELKQVNGSILGETDNGRITLQTGSLDRNIDMRTDNGSILIETETKPANVSIHTKTSHGRIDVFGDSNSRTVFGQGEYTVKLKSSNGRITVR